MSYGINISHAVPTNERLTRILMQKTIAD